MIATTLRRLALLAALPLALCAPCAAQDLVVRGGRVVVEAEKGAQPRALIVIRAGKVLAAGAKTEVPAGAEVLDRSQAWITPGLVDARAHLGLEGDIDERSRPFANDIDLADRVNKGHKDFRRHLAAGITTLLLSPGDQAVMSGAAVPVKSTGQVLGEARVAKLSLTSAAAAAGPPTSKSGRLALLRARLREAHRAKGGGPFEAFAAGDIPGLISVRSLSTVESVQRMAAKFGLRAIYDLQTPVQQEDLEGLSLEGVTFALRPSRVSASRAQRSEAGLLAKAKATVIFTSQAPYGPSEGMRLAAAQAARAGLSGRAALAGLTSAPAKALGLEGQVGTLTPGAEGDFVVWSGPPLDLRSRVLEVYVAGKRVYSAAEEE
jgi:imidazolonepropionase-like amidohydrolase